MIGSLLSRPLLMIFGYVYPAYECYKLVERYDSEMGQLKLWCQYWILVALLSTCERIGDNIMSWLPLYDEAKLALVLYLWYPKTMGTKHIYSSLVRPYLAEHERQIDLRLMKMRTKVGMIITSLWQKALSYGSYGFFEALQYISSQSALMSQPNQDFQNSQ